MFSEDVANVLTGRLGTYPYLALAFGLFFVGPPLLVIEFAYLLGHRDGRDRGGILVGLSVAVWASLCWVIVPYCGAYPCLPALVITTAANTPPMDSLQGELLLHAANFALWPSLGWLVFRAANSIRKGS